LLDGSVNSITLNGSTFSLTSHPSLFVNPDPDGFLLVYNEDLVTAIVPGTQTEMQYLINQGSTGQSDGVYLITDTEIPLLVGKEGEINSLGLQFSRGSLNTLPGNITI